MNRPSKKTVGKLIAIGVYSTGLFFLLKAPFSIGMGVLLFLMGRDMLDEVSKLEENEEQTK